MWEFPVSVLSWPVMNVTCIGCVPICGNSQSLLSWLVMNVTCIGGVPICGNSQSLCWADLSWMLLVLVVFPHVGIPSLHVELTCHECYLYWSCSYMWEFLVSCVELTCHECYLYWSWMLLVLVVFLYVGIPSLCVELTCQECYLYWSWMLLVLVVFLYVGIPSLCWGDCHECYLYWSCSYMWEFPVSVLSWLVMNVTCIGHECYLYWLCSYMWEFPVSVLSWLVMNVTCIGHVPICRWWIMTGCAQSPPWQVASYGNLWVCHWHGETSFVKAKSISCRILLISITC